MHCLIALSVEYFIRSHYGAARWHAIRAAVGADLQCEGVGAPELWLKNDQSDLFQRVADQLGQRRERLLDDLGAWLARIESVSKILRFMGSDYVELLHALEELPARLQMLLPEFDMPGLTVEARSPHDIQIKIGPGADFWPLLLGGVLRGMASDYGIYALFLVGPDSITVDLAADAHSGPVPGSFPAQNMVGHDDFWH